ncbi:hypothetical protein ACFYNM_39360 [Streptomyces spororaveus]|uniref:hypothetical protein n=1 Tax=Streptomyces spororaveus TaxID=284039 RepID=UPI0036BE86D9
MSTLVLLVLLLLVLVGLIGMAILGYVTYRYPRVGTPLLVAGAFAAVFVAVLAAVGAR